MKKIIATSIALVGIAWATGASAQMGARIGLPVGGGPNGLTTSVGFQPSWGGRGRFVGVRIERIVPGTFRVRIRRQFSGGGVLYDGPIRPGQFIRIDVTRIVWTAWKSTRGNHMNGIVVRAMYR